jgi:hypothetical protein
MDAKNVRKIKKSAFAANYAQILVPGSYLVKASNSNRIFDAGLGKYKYIINVKAVAAHNIEKVIALFDGKEELEVEALNGLTMNGSIILDDSTSHANTPLNNELVKITVDFRPSKGGGEDILVITAIKVSEPVKATGFSFDKPKAVAVTEEAKAGEKKPIKPTVEKASVAKTAEPAAKNPAEDF